MLSNLQEPVAARLLVESGGLSGRTGGYETRLSHLAGLYEDAAAYEETLRADGDPVVYAVDEFRPSERSGDLIFGVTRMAPGRIGEEFFLTRGHLHRRSDRPEIYQGLSGRGVMLMESPCGTTRTVEIAPQTVCYVPPYWIHRSVNVGETELTMFFCYPADSGQDYDCIRRTGGMRHRVKGDGRDGWKLTPNLGYTPRSPEEVDALLCRVAG